MTRRGRERAISNGGDKSTGSRGQWYTWCAVLLDALRSARGGLARSGGERVGRNATSGIIIPLSGQESHYLQYR